MSKTKIEWVQGPDGMIGETWNPTVGCSKISPGCKNCYAIRHVHRMAGNPNPKIRAANEGLTVIQGGEPNWTGKVRLIPERLEIPLRRRKPTTYFVNSLSDLFHESLDDDSIERVFCSMALAHQHRYQILTKRSERLPTFFNRLQAVADEWKPKTKSGNFSPSDVLNFRHMWRTNGRGPAFPNGPWPLPNVWLGVSVESKDYLYRIDDLRCTPAAVRFLSLEPLLEDLGQMNLEGISWVIAGAESGKGARPMNLSWVRSIRDQCVSSSVPFFFKQDAVRGRKVATPQLDGKIWTEMPNATL